MENIDLSQQVPDGVAAMIAIGGILVLSVLVVAAVLVMRKWRGRFITLIVGLAAYFIFIFFGLNWLMGLLTSIPAVGNAFAGSKMLSGIVVSLVTALLLMAARLVMCKICTGKYDRKGDIALAGVGLAAGDCISFVVSMITYNNWCNVIQSEGLEAALSSVDQSMLQATYDSISVIFASPKILWIMMSISFCMDIILNMAFICMVYGTMKGFFAKYFYLVILAVSFICDLSVQLYDIHSETSILIAFGIKMILFAAVVYYTMMVKNKEIKYEDD